MSLELILPIECYWTVSTSEVLHEVRIKNMPQMTQAELRRAFGSWANLVSSLTDTGQDSALELVVFPKDEHEAVLLKLRFG